MTDSKRVKLSDYQLDQARADPALREVVDTGCPGLMLRFHKQRQTGSWYVFWYQKGVRRAAVFARWPTHSLEQARAQVAIELDRLAGRPASEPLQEFSCCGDVLRWYVDRVSNQRSISASRRRSIRSIVSRRLLPFLADIPLTEITPHRLDDAWWQILQRDYATATLSASLKELKRAFRLAVTQRRIATNPLDGVTLQTFGAPNIKPKAGKLRPFQVGEVIAALGDSDRCSVSLVLLLLLHGTRIGETRQTQWSHFDLAGRVWHIPDDLTKSRRGYAMPLTAMAIAVLEQWRAQQQRRGYSGPWLFPDGHGHSICARHATRLIASVSRGRWSAHDLRKLFRSRLDEQGTPYTLAEAMVNHAMGKLDQTYILTADAMAAKRAALETYHAWLCDNKLTI